MALINLISEKLTLCKPTFANLRGFLDEKFSDVTVTVSYPNLEIKSYRLHRIVLAGCSMVLHQSMEHHQTLDITFMSPGEFELLIMFLYTGDVFFQSVSELCAGLFAANIYQIENLRCKCSERLRQKLSEDCGNALLILQCDERFHFRADNIALFELVEEKINKDYREILSCGVIDKIEKNTLEHLLQMESVSGVPEVEVFRALLRWTNARCCKLSIEPVPENLQEVAGDLIYQIRYNLIPAELVGKEVVKSGMLPQNLIGPVFQRLYDKELKVPFCTRSREKNEYCGATAVCASNQAEWKFKSTCTNQKHTVQPVGRYWTVDTTLSWSGEGQSAWFRLPEAAFSNILLEVQFSRKPNNNFSISMGCSSLDAQYHAASVRLFAVVKDAPHVWMEVAAVMESGGVNWYSRFSEKVTELPTVRPIKVRVRAQWTELDQLPSTSNWKKNPIRCRWQLRGWKAVTPTAEKWSLCSEPFGGSGALWRIFVYNIRVHNKRQLNVRVYLNYLSASVDRSVICWNCSLSVWGEQFNEQKTNMIQDSRCEWTVVDNVKLESRDPLDLKVVIHFS